MASFVYSKFTEIILRGPSMLGIPWETIVKMYRECLGTKEFAQLSEYSADFFKYLDNFDVSSDLQEKYIVQGAFQLFHKIKQRLNEWVNDRINNTKKVTSEEIAKRLIVLIQNCHNRFVKVSEDSVLSKTRRARLKSQYKKVINEVILEIFEKRPLSNQAKEMLLEISVNAAAVGPLNQSGIVIAGFGTKDLYPRCQSFDVAAVFAGKTIKRSVNDQAISHDTGAAIIPFAQSDDVRTFMEGIGPGLKDFLESSFYEIMIHRLPDKLAESISERLLIEDTRQGELRKIAEDMCKGACDYAFKKLTEKQSDEYITPVVRATEFLNKAELAAMAEALVNLVSFRKQVTMEVETVGGPIDVAVISKGDGLVWIKRKNYFPAELNHHFFRNYNRKIDHHD